MQVEKYQSFSTEDFLNDPAFIRFVRYQEELDFWNEFEEASPANVAYHAARKELEFIYTASRITMPAGFETALLAQIDASVDRQQNRKSVFRKLYVAIGSAAALAGIVMTWLWLNSSYVNVSTAYGEKKTVTLPDGSTVTLNANSSIKYPLMWRFNHKRDVQLKGQAYFKVVHLNKDPRHITAAERFRVKTDRLQIEVLGTEFDVKDRNQTAKIVLTKGSVSVYSMVTGKRYILKPKQMALETKEEALKIVQTDPVAEQAWTEGNMNMQKTTVREILQEFEDVYGQHVKLSDPAMADVTIDGVISFKSQESVLFVLANILNAKVTKDSTAITLQAKN